MVSKFTEDLRTKMSDITYEVNEEDYFLKLKTKSDILKNYRIVRQIGKGLFSKVYLAIDGEGCKVALKVISKEKFDSRETIEKIVIEKEVMRRLSHRNILKLYRTLQTNTKIYFVLEFAERGSLINLLNLKMRISVEEIRYIAAQIIEALVYMHSQGIVYGDLKAENVLLNKKGIVKICDFNLSGTEDITGGSVQGTINYIAPETIERNERQAKSDFWALGVLLHLLFYRRWPFVNKNQTEFFSNVLNNEVISEPVDFRAPAAFRRFILDLLVKNPAKRLGNNMKEFTTHPFFAGFNWSLYHLKPMNFNVLDTVNDESQLSESLSSNESEPPIPLNQMENKFIYNIGGFTFENLSTEGPVSADPLRRSNFHSEIVKK